MVMSLMIPAVAVGQTFVRVSDSAGIVMPLIPGTGTNGIAIADDHVYIVARESYMPGDARTWNRLFVRTADHRFTDRTNASGIVAQNIGSMVPNAYGYKMGASWGDFNNDGFPDLFLTHQGADQLFRNNGNGGFTDITTSAGVAGRPTQLSTSAVWFDADNDGLLDLYVCVLEDYASPSDRRNRFYRNLGNGQFEDRSSISGLDDAGLSWMALPIDVNLDGWMDVYVANDFGRNKLYVNQGDGTFLEQTTLYNVEDWREGMGLASADVNGDGFPDIYVTNVTEMPGRDERFINTLFLSHPDSIYVERAVEAGVSLAGWGWGAAFFDADNDGRQDLMVTNGYFDNIFPNRLFRNTSTPDVVRFEDAGQELGVADIADSRALAVFDFNDDGAMDMIMSNASLRPVLYQNRLASGNWVKVALEGVASNRNGFGARLEFTHGDQTQTMFHHGAQFLAQNILPVHVGLGDATSLDRLRIHWPSGMIDNHFTLSANASYSFREGETTSIESQSNSSHPIGIRFLDNYPNPFNNQTRIRFEIDQAGTVDIEIISLLGQRVWHTVKKGLQAGIHSFDWLPTGGFLNSGIYLCRISVNGQPSTVGKLTLLK